MNDASPGMGHNQPSIFERIAELIANCNRWLVERQQIATPEQAGQATTFVEQLRAATADLAAQLDVEKQPLEDAILVLRLRFKEPGEKLAIALASMEAKNRDWLQRERDRLDAERVEREREANDAIREAAQRQSDAEQPGATVEDQLAAKRANERAAKLTGAALDAGKAKPQMKGDLSTRAMSLRSNWKARVVDADKALAHFATNDVVRDAAVQAIERIATKMAKAQKGKAPIPPGIAFWNDERAS